MGWRGPGHYTSTQGSDDTKTRKYQVATRLGHTKRQYLTYKTKSGFLTCRGQRQQGKLGLRGTPESVRYIGRCARSPTQQEGTHVVPTRGNLGATLKTKQRSLSRAEMKRKQSNREASASCKRGKPALMARVERPRARAVALILNTAGAKSIKTQLPITASVLQIKRAVERAEGIKPS